MEKSRAVDLLKDYVIFRKVDVDSLPKKLHKNLEEVRCLIGIRNTAEHNLLTVKEITSSVLRKYMEDNLDVLKEAKRVGFNEGLKNAKEEQKADRRRAFDKGFAFAKKEIAKENKRIANNVRELKNALNALLSCIEDDKGLETECTEKL